MTGANYYAAARQFQEAEKTIRLTNLLKFNKLDMADIKEMFSETSLAAEKQIDIEVSALIGRVNIPLRLEDISLEDNGILFYVSGYIARSIKKSTKCSSCMELIVKDDTEPIVNVEDVENRGDYKCFFNAINRGGLCNPSDMVHITTVHAYEFFSLLFRNKE